MSNKSKIREKIHGNLLTFFLGNVIWKTKLNFNY